MPEPLLRVIWTDPVSGKHGYAVIDTLVQGITGGGTRMRKGCTLEEVERLAETMSYKTAAFEIAVGGMKVGLDCDPRDPDAHEVLVRFIEALRPYFAVWMNTGEDMGTASRCSLPCSKRQAPASRWQRPSTDPRTPPRLESDWWMARPT